MASHTPYLLCLQSDCMSSSFKCISTWSYLLIYSFYFHTHVSIFYVMSFVYVQSDLLSPFFCVVLFVLSCVSRITKMNSRRFVSFGNIIIKP